MHRRQFLKASLSGVALLSIGQAGCDGEGDGSRSTVVTTTVGTAHLSYDARGNVYEIESTHHVVRRLDRNGRALWQVGGLGSDEGELNFPDTLTVDDDGLVYVADRGNSRIAVFDAEGTFVRHIGGRDSSDATGRDRSGLDFARQVAVDPNGSRVYVCDTNDNQIEIFDGDGTHRGAFGEFGTSGAGLNHPVGLALDTAGNIHVVDGGNFRIQVYAPTGDYVRTYGRRGRGSGELLLPRAIVIDHAGRSWVADTAGFHLDVFRADGGAEDAVPVRFADGRAGCPLDLSLTPDDDIYVTAVPLPAGV